MHNDKRRAQRKRCGMAGSYLRQLSQLVSIQEQLLQTAAVAVDLIRDRGERAVPLIHGLDVTVTPPQRDTLQHDPGKLNPSASGTDSSSQTTGGTRPQPVSKDDLPQIKASV